MPGARKPPAPKKATAREMWLQAIKGRSPTVGSSKKGLSTTKKTPNEYWIGTLRKSQGLQNEIASMDTFGSNRPPGDSVPYLSTSHYLREKVGSERPANHKSTKDLRAAPGTPAYKTPEEYYDEVLDLRKQISSMGKDCSLLKAKLRRVEEDNTKKEKEIEVLMDPAKSGDLVRTLTDRRPDSSAVVHSLKQKIMRLDQQLKEKEHTISTMKSDVKSTNIDEVRLKMEMFYQEIVRLRNSKAPTSNQTATSKSKTKETKESSSKIKALNETILRMNEKVVKITAENKSLKEDLEKLMNEAAEIKEKKRDYDDMSRKQLVKVLAQMELKMEAQNQSARGDASSVSSTVSKLDLDNPEKLELEGTMAQRLEALDKRETELIEHIKQLNASLKKAKEDKQTYRQKSEEKGKEIKALKKEIDKLTAELEQYYDKERLTSSRQSNRAPSPQISSSRRSSIKDRPPSPRERRLSSVSKAQEKHERQIEKFRENHAARTIQREWRRHHEEEQQAQRVEQFRTNRAARTIQNHWINHQNKRQNQELDDAALLIQSTIRGNEARKRQIQRNMADDEEDELSDAAELIQSSVRGHWSRKNAMKSLSRASSFGSEDYNSDDAAAQIQAALRGHRSRKQYISDSQSSRPPSARSALSQNRAKNGSKGRLPLDSAGEDENISDEVPTPRRSSSKKTPPASRGKKVVPKYTRNADDDDDEDIMF